MGYETDRLVAAGLNRYAWALDHRDWPLLAKAFSEHAIAKFGPNSTLHGREDILGGVRFYLDSCGPSQHMIGNIDVDDTRDGIASRCYVRAVHRAREGDAMLWSFGEYHARWVMEDGDLKIDRWEMRVGFNHGDDSAFGI